ncbi:MAG: FixH family protein [Phycisphaerales bacterium]
MSDVLMLVLGDAGSGGAVLLPTFGRPWWLAFLLPAWAALWWMSRKSLTGWDARRKGVYLALRCVVAGLVICALAEPLVRWRGNSVAVVAVVDTSESVPLDQRRLAAAFLDGSLTKRPDGDRFGLVTVARDAHVQSLPTREPGRSTEIGDGGRGDASHLDNGVELAKGLLPTDAAGRVLLISDGNETAGSLANTAARFASLGVPIDVAGVEYDRGSMVRVVDVATPAWARDGDTVTARIVIDGGKGATGRLSVLLDDQPVDLDPATPGNSVRVELAPGRQALVQQLRLPAGPVHKVQAVFEPDDAQKSIPQLLRGESVTFTSGHGRVLVLAEDVKAAELLAEAMRSEDVRVDVRPAAAAPASLAEWAGYDGVVLVDQPASNFTQAQQEEMARYVHDAGGGLLVVGGPNSFGAGGWIGSPLADVLPVALDPPQKRQMPMGALAIVIDHSGSMAAPVTGTGMTQQQIANESAVLGIRALSRLDEVAVIEFDHRANVVVPLTRCDDAEGITRKIRSIGPSGGTFLLPGLEAAEAELGKSKAGVKHIVVLTDGETSGEPGDLLSRASALRARGVTMTTVAIGDAANSKLLGRLAQAGGGRWYNVESENSKAVLTQIFIKEAQTVKRSLVWEGPAFAPTVSTWSDSMRGIGGTLPGVTGYVVTADRGGLSTVSLRGPEGDPILAQWQHGLGRVTAFTSDASSRWNAAWTSWDSFKPFWEQQLKWAMRPTGDLNSKVAVDVHGDKATATVELFDADGGRVNFATLNGRLAAPGEGGKVRDVTFRQTGPGRYEAEVDASEAGTHLLAVRYGVVAADGRERGGSVRAAVVRRADEEFRAPTPATTLLWDLARKTGGRVYHLDKFGTDLWVREHVRMPESSQPAWLVVAILAVCTFMVDVAARRITLEGVGAQIAGLLKAGPQQAAGASMAALAVAKSRAGENREPRVAEPVSEPIAAQQPREVPTVTPPTVRAEQRPVKVEHVANPQGGDAFSRLQAAKNRSRARRGDDESAT